MPTPSSHTATADGTTIHYVTWGKPSAPPVVLLHGLRAYGEWFAPLGEALADRSYVIAPDLRGRNLSAWAKDGDYTVEAYCRDLAGLAAHLKLGRFALGGHSLGAAVVARYASEHPDQIAALLLFDGSPEPDPRGRGRIMDEVARTPVDGFPNWAAAEAFLRTIHTKASDAHIKTRLRCMLKEEGGALKWRIDRACTKPNVGTPEQYWASLRAIKCPTLHLRGSESDLLSADVHTRMVAATPDGHKVEIPGAAHMVIEDNEKGVVDAAVAFLDRHYLKAKAA
jgi:pimeloyl-ACP methyl ester carboxylesterase